MGRICLVDSFLIICWTGKVFADKERDTGENDMCKDEQFHM